MNLLIDRKDWLESFSSTSKYRPYFYSIKEFPNELRAFCKDNNIELILSVIFDSSLCVNERDLEELPWCLPSKNALKMEDKRFAKNWLQENGFINHLPKQIELDKFPYVLKIGNGTGGSNVHYIECEKQLAQLGPTKENYSTEEYISAPYEYVYHFVAKNDVVLIERTYQHDFLSAYQKQSHYIRGHRIRNTNIAHYTLATEHKVILHDIIQKLDYSGFGCFDLKILGKQLYILEMNTRMGGSLLFYNHLLNDLEAFLQVYSTLIE